VLGKEENVGVLRTESKQLADDGNSIVKIAALIVEIAQLNAHLHSQLGLFKPGKSRLKMRFGCGISQAFFADAEQPLNFHERRRGCEGSAKILAGCGAIAAHPLDGSEVSERASVMRIDGERGAELALCFNGVVRPQRCFAIAEVVACGWGICLGGCGNSKDRQHRQSKHYRYKDAHLLG
jgi:hypothetical protein